MGRVFLCRAPDGIKCSCGAGEDTPGGMHHDTCLHNPRARMAAREERAAGNPDHSGPKNSNASGPDAQASQVRSVGA